MREVLLDSVVDCLKILPFLYLSYLAVEYTEHRMSAKTKEMIYRAGKAGPILGSLIGTIPQCGFAAAAAGLFAAGVVSPGTLLAVFLATSDEMLPVMLSRGTGGLEIVKILAAKAAVAAAAGMLADFAAERLIGRREPIPDHMEMCGHGHCGCEHHGIWYSAWNHTLKTMLFLFLISLVLGFGMEQFASSGLSGGLAQSAGLEAAASAVIGMIPNCAASVLVTELFLEGVLSSVGLFAGILCGAGTGLLVLYRENRNLKVNLAFTAGLFVVSAAAGLLLGQLKIV